MIGPVLEGVLRNKDAVPDEVLDSDKVNYVIESANSGHGHLIVLDARTSIAWLLIW